MKSKMVITIAVTFFVIFAFTLAVAFFGMIYMDRYQTALSWVEDGVFSKASSYIDEFPFIMELHDPGFVDYVYAGEHMEHRHYEEAISLLEPLAERNYRDSAQMLEECLANLK